MVECEARNIKVARILFERAMQANPRNAATYQSWGVMEAKQGHFNEAVELFRSGLQCQPRNTFLLQVSLDFNFLDDLVVGRRLIGPSKMPGVGRARGSERKLDEGHRTF
jgi:tetratricopeptide (TPR) repeat protein